MNKTILLSLGTMLLLLLTSSSVSIFINAQEEQEQAQEERKKISIDEAIGLAKQWYNKSIEYSEASKKIVKMLELCGTVGQAEILYDYIPECVAFIEDLKNASINLAEKYQNLR